MPTYKDGQLVPDPAPAPETTAIIKPDTKTLGAALVSEAEKRNEENRRETLLGSVANLMHNRDEYLERADFATKAAAWYDKKLKALQAGEFEFNSRTGAITPIDPDLQRANY
jgi:hypothetical protein